MGGGIQIGGETLDATPYLDELNRQRQLALSQQQMLLNSQQHQDDSYNQAMASAAQNKATVDAARLNSQNEMNRFGAQQAQQYAFHQDDVNHQNAALAQAKQEALLRASQQDQEWQMRQQAQDDNRAERVQRYGAINDARKDALSAKADEASARAAANARLPWERKAMLYEKSGEPELANAAMQKADEAEAAVKNGTPPETAPMQINVPPAVTASPAAPQDTASDQGHAMAQDVTRRALELARKRAFIGDPTASEEPQPSTDDIPYQDNPTVIPPPPSLDYQFAQARQQKNRQAQADKAATFDWHTQNSQREAAHQMLEEKRQAQMDADRAADKIAKATEKTAPLDNYLSTAKGDIDSQPTPELRNAAIDAAIARATGKLGLPAAQPGPDGKVKLPAHPNPLLQAELDQYQTEAQADVAANQDAFDQGKHPMKSPISIWMSRNGKNDPDLKGLSVPTVVARLNALRSAAPDEPQAPVMQKNTTTPATSGAQPMVGQSQRVQVLAQRLVNEKKLPPAEALARAKAALGE